MYNRIIGEITKRYFYGTPPSGRYPLNENKMVVNQPRTGDVRVFFKTTMYKPSKALMAFVVTRSYLKHIVLNAIDYLESRFGKDKRNLFRLAFLLAGMYGKDILQTIVAQSANVCYSERDYTKEKTLIDSVFNNVDLGDKVPFTLDDKVSMPPAALLFVQKWTKEYYSNLINQYDYNMFFVHLASSIASIEKSDIINQTLSWASCDEGHDVWSRRNKEYMDQING